VRFFVVEAFVERLAPRAAQTQCLLVEGVENWNPSIAFITTGSPKSARCINDVGVMCYVTAPGSVGSSHQFTPLPVSKEEYPILTFFVGHGLIFNFAFSTEVQYRYSEGSLRTAVQPIALLSLLSAPDKQCSLFQHACSWNLVDRDTRHYVARGLFRDQKRDF
jgi:hypothetical protein